MGRPFRYTIILVLVAIGTALAAVGGWRYARASAPVNGPIVLISIDTLRADHLPVYGYTHGRTPNIDALANDGIVFERAYSHVPQTLPAHVALLSGRLPFETGVRDNVGFAVKHGERMLPQMLRDRGYKTGGVVSAYVLRKDTGINQGFDFFDAGLPAVSPELAISELQRPGIESEAIAEHWLNSVGTSRVFLFLHLYEPHKPYTPPPEYADLAPYDGEIAYSDAIVGRLFTYLKRHDLYDRSTIILLSDHGEGLGDHGEQEHGLLLYDEAVHVPLIIKQPEREGHGRRVKAPVQHIDVVPTVLDLVKAPIPGNLHGRSLKPLLDGSGPIPEQAIYAEALYGRYHFGWSELTSLTDDRYRYIKAPREELYDLQRDPHERANLAGDRLQAAQAMRGALTRLVAGAPIAAPSAVSAEDRQRLQALGYVGAQADTSSTRSDARPDPKDKRDLLEKYRAAIDLAGQRRWNQGVVLLQQILATDPEMADVWSQLAMFAIRADRTDLAIDAYRHYIELAPADPQGYLGAANALLHARRLNEAREHAELAANVAKTDSRMRGDAYELLARIALAAKDAGAARAAAAAAQKANPALVTPAFVEARLLYDEGRFADALPIFLRAATEQSNRGGLQMPELHFYAGDTAARLERYPEAEKQFDEELRYFPQNTRARAGLAMLYQATGRPDDAARAIADLTRAVPTADSYALAARLWTIFGNPRNANAVRAEARRALADAPRRGGPAPRPNP